MTANIRLANLFSALNDEQVKQILENSNTLKLQDGESLFESGDKAERFYLVIGGQIKLFRGSPSGDEKIIDIIQPGNTFAEAIMFMNNPVYPVSAEALGPARVMSFDNKRFLDILSHSSETSFRIMGTMSQRLRGLIRQIDELTLQSATTRLCATLLRYMEEAGSEIFKLPAAKGVLAARLSMKPETFSRILHNLSSKQIIKVTGNEVSVLNVEQLKQLAHTEAIVGLEPDASVAKHHPCVSHKDLE
ncbi:MAG: Crp/Fnr family transcriptional regulator [Candidatus Thiodiazotropha sp. 'RUGA']|nr:Crp/Fnr family transcriptional regulator [Candidatus Thiodiazotropha sp. 'RUGA']